jgi:anthraniloyl-CoA monooxygenase
MTGCARCRAGMALPGSGARQMLILLQARARELGVDLQFETEFKSAEDYRRDYDLVVGCDGINSLCARI